MATSETMITSSSRLRMRSSTGCPPKCPPGAKIPSRPRLAGQGRDQAALGLGRDEARGFVDAVDEFLAEPALHFLLHRHQLARPGGFFAVGLLMALHLAAGFDQVHRGTLV